VRFRRSKVRLLPRPRTLALAPCSHVELARTAPHRTAPHCGARAVALCPRDHRLMLALVPCALFPANCLDCERLLSLAFDKLGFLRSFSNNRIEALRRKHRARLLALEAPPSPPRSPSRAAAPSAADSAPSYSDQPATMSSLSSSEVATSRESLLAPLEDDSSDEEADDELGDGEPAGEYDVVSHDDVREPARSFWL
jgi:hypothetical protein